MKNVRVWVGTMYSGESEYEDSKRSVSQQTGVDISHFLIEGKSEHDAAVLLYSTWESLKSNYDFFVQVDADTILRHPRVIEQMYHSIKDSHEYTSVQAPLHDFLTDSHIMGLNGYMPSIRWVTDTTDKLYTDRCHVGNITKISGLPESLIPAGLHASQPTDMQAYHFGVHRGLKNQIGRREQVFSAWCRSGYDMKRGLALLGFHDSKKYYMNGGFNYIDSLFITRFQFVKSNYENLIKSII